jgi:hypothetical protein
MSVLSRHHLTRGLLRLPLRLVVRRGGGCDPCQTWALLVARRLARATASSSSLRPQAQMRHPAHRTAVPRRAWREVRLVACDRLVRWQRGDLWDEGALRSQHGALVATLDYSLLGARRAARHAACASSGSEHLHRLALVVLSEHGGKTSSTSAWLTLMGVTTPGRVDGRETLSLGRRALSS